MNRHNQQNELTSKALIYRIVITIIVIFIVCLYMPRDTRSNFQFDLGKPWRYNQVIATYDFPIYKSAAVIHTEQDSILKKYKTYFGINTSSAKEQNERFSTPMEAHRPAIVPAPYLTYIENKLRIIYARGVMQSEDYDRMHTEQISNIRVFIQNEATEESLDQVFSHKTAYEYLVDPGSDSMSYDRNLLRKCNLIDYIVPNLTYDKTKSEDSRKDLLSSLSYSSGMVMSGQKIIDRGDIVDEKTYDILTSMEKEYAKRNESKIQSHTVLIGQLIYVGIIILCLGLYFSLFRRDYLINVRSILFIASLPVIYPLITAFFIKQNLFSVYLIPFAMIPICIRVFMDSRTAFVTHLATVLISAMALKYPYEFIATQLIAGMVAIYSLRELSQRSQLIRSAFYITLTSIVFYFSIELIHEKDFARLKYGMYIYFIINGALLLFAYPFLFLFEKIFGFTSNVTLVELSNTNNELLRRLSEVAPGTFQHSMQVANLATEVANKIGAKSLLVRTGALYHDIGKMNNPAYFTENQNNINPHDRLSYEQSAAIVISHVKDGLKLADKYMLPQVIKDFISTHHGKGRTKYFLISYQNRHPNEPVDESLFTYPGPNPFTLGQAILMMADSVEAASRSLNEYTEESISELVDKIIDGQVNDGFFKDCPITFHDINTAKEVFKVKLKTIYHTRISYPELKKQPETAAQTGSTSK
ncbi:MAG: HDIG domain-containing protein [Paraprevotella sp.]|nr:HDIG domain-containing protein [Paraprevotella sp.]